MRLLRRQNVIKVVTPKALEDLIKDLLEFPESFGKTHFATKLILSASATSGPELRQNILDWLASLNPEQGDSSEPTRIEIKPSLNKLFDELRPEDKNGETA